MFRDDFQKAAACQALCARAGRKQLWTPTGPADLALEYLRSDGGPLSHGEKVMLFTAFALWNGEGGLTLDEMINTLDGPNLALVATLLAALSAGSDALDAWLEEHLGGS